MVVSSSWRGWVLENLARGAAPDDLVEALVAQRVPAPMARACVRGQERSQLLALVRREGRRAQQLALHGRLRRDLGPIDTVARRPTCDVGEFFGHYWGGGIPVVFDDLVTRWPAFGRWTPDWLAARFGTVDVEACVGRSSHSDPDMNFAALRESMPLRTFVQRMRAAPDGNDLYLIANNRNTAREGLRPLFDDLWLPEGWFNAPSLPTSSALWLGRAGAVTALHHDTSNILFCQVHGRKRVKLGRPDEPALLDACRGLYNRFDPDGPDADDVLLAVDLSPGDALFVPVGWWHHVVAIDESISLALNGFARANTFAWYRPGRC